MIHFEGNITCSKCGITYNWALTDGNNVFGKLNDIAENVKAYEYVPSLSCYRIRVGCPYCNNNESIEVDQNGN